jgi:hypothetical protein
MAATQQQEEPAVAAARAREEGNAAFKAGDFGAAAAAYTRGVKALRGPPPAGGDDCDALSFTLRCNRSAAHAARGAYRAALADANAAVALAPQDGGFKAHLRRGAALNALGRCAAAFQRAAALAPAGSPDAAACAQRAELARLREEGASERDEDVQAPGAAAAREARLRRIIDLAEAPSVRDALASAEARTCLAMEAMAAAPRDARALLDAARGALSALRRVPLASHERDTRGAAVHDTLLSWAHAAGLALALLGEEGAGAVAHLRMAVAAAERVTQAVPAALEQTTASKRIAADDADAAAAADAATAHAALEQRLASDEAAAPPAEASASAAAAAAADDKDAPNMPPRLPGQMRLGHHLLMLAQVLLNAREFDEAAAVLQRVEALPAEDSAASAATSVCVIRGNMEMLRGDMGAAIAAFRAAVAADDAHAAAVAAQGEEEEEEGVSVDAPWATLVSLANLLDERHGTHHAADAAEAAACRGRAADAAGVALPAACALCGGAIDARAPTPPSGGALHMLPCCHVFHAVCLLEQRVRMYRLRAQDGTAPPPGACPTCKSAQLGVVAPPPRDDAAAAAPLAAERTPAPRGVNDDGSAAAAKQQQQQWQLRTVFALSRSRCSAIPTSDSCVAPCSLASLPRDAAVFPTMLLQAKPVQRQTPSLLRFPDAWRVAAAASGAVVGPPPARHIVPLHPAAARDAATLAALPLTRSAGAALGDTILLFGGIPSDAALGVHPFGDALWAITGAAEALTDGTSQARVARVPTRAAVAADGVPSGRVSAAAAAHGGRFYVLGGARMPQRGARPAGRSGMCALWDALWEFTPDDAASPGAGGTWRKVPLTGARPAGAQPGLFGAATALLPATGELLLLSGETNEGLSRDVFSVHLASGAVRCLAPPPGCAAAPRPRTAAAAATLPDSARVLFGGGGAPSNGWDAGDAWLFDVRTHAWTALPIDDAIGADADAAAGDASAVVREYQEAHALQEGARPPVFAHYTHLHVVAAAAEHDDPQDDGGAALAVVWGGISHEPLSAALGAGAALPRTLANGALRVMRIEPRRPPAAAAAAANNN